MSITRTHTRPDGLIEICFWQTEKHDGPLPYPKKMKWPGQDDFVKDLMYVQGHMPKNNQEIFRGFLTCRICGIRLGTHMHYKTGNFVWRSDLLHYVEQHNIQPKPYNFRHVICNEAQSSLQDASNVKKSKIKAKSIPAALAPPIPPSLSESLFKEAMNMLNNIYTNARKREVKFTMSQYDKLADLTDDLEEEWENYEAAKAKFAAVKTSGDEDAKADAFDAAADDLVDFDDGPLLSKPAPAPKKKLTKVGFFDDEDDLDVAVTRIELQRVTKYIDRLKWVESDAATTVEHTKGIDRCQECSYKTTNTVRYECNGFQWPGILLHYMEKHDVLPGGPFEKWLETIKVDASNKSSSSDNDLNDLIGKLGVSDERGKAILELLKLVVK